VPVVAVAAPDISDIVGCDDNARVVILGEDGRPAVTLDRLQAMAVATAIIRTVTGLYADAGEPPRVGALRAVRRRSCVDDELRSLDEL
jgi:hypothetical protein